MRPKCTKILIYRYISDDIIFDKADFTWSYHLTEYKQGRGSYIFLEFPKDREEVMYVCGVNRHELKRFR